MISVKLKLHFFNLLWTCGFGCATNPQQIEQVESELYHYSYS